MPLASSFLMPRSSSVVAACLVFVALSVLHLAIGSTASSLWRRQPSTLPLNTKRGVFSALGEESQPRKAWRSAQLQPATEEAAGYISDVLRQLETRIDDEPRDQTEAGEEEERHPGEKLLQSHRADATESYILGGY